MTKEEMEMGNLHIIMYHYTRDLKNSRYPNIKGLDYAMFHEQIMFLKRKFNIVTMEQVLEAVWSGGGVFSGKCCFAYI